MAREETLIAEAKETLERLEAETRLARQHGRLAADFEQKALAAHDQAETALKGAEVRLTELTTAAAEARARRQSLESQTRERREQVAKLERQLVGLEAQTREIIGRAPDASKLKAATELGQQLMAEIAKIEAETLAAEEAVQAAPPRPRPRARAARQRGLRAGQLKTEVETLAKLLTPAGDSRPAADPRPSRSRPATRWRLPPRSATTSMRRWPPRRRVHWRAERGRASGSGVAGRRRAARRLTSRPRPS